MVLLAITAAGLEDALRLASETDVSVWCGSDAMLESDYKARALPALSRFNYPLQGASADTLSGALDTIAEHHAGEIIWVEGRGEV